MKDNSDNLLYVQLRPQEHTSAATCFDKPKENTLNVHFAVMPYSISFQLTQCVMLQFWLADHGPPWPDKMLLPSCMLAHGAQKMHCRPDCFPLFALV